MKNAVALSLMLGLGIAGTGQVRATELNPQAVAADAKIVMHLDTEKLWGSELGRQMKADLDKGEAKVKLDAALAIFGMDLLNDIKGITLYGGDVAAMKDDWRLLGSGNFDPERLLVLLRATEGYSVQAYNGHDLHHWVDKHAGDDPAQNQRWGAFVGKKLVVIAGREAAAKGALDVLDGREQAMVADGKVGKYSLTAGRGAILFLAVSAANAALKQNANAVMLQNVDGGCLRAWETDARLNLQLSMSAVSAETAQPLEQIVRGVQAMGMLQQGRAPELAQLAQAMTVSRDGLEVKVDFSYPSASLATMMKAMREKHQGRPHGNGCAAPENAPAK